MLDVIIGNLPSLITALIAISFLWKYGSKALKLINEIQELLVAIVVAFADRKLTQEELDKIVKEARDIPEAIREMLSKKKD